MMLSLICQCAEVTKEAAKVPWLDWLMQKEIFAALLPAIVVALGWVVESRVRRAHRKSVVRKYRVFLCYSAWALQDRIYSIFHKGFAKYYSEKKDPWGRFDDVYAANAVNYSDFSMKKS